MKLKSYFLLSIVVGMTFACSSDENVPEVEVFTPDATLSLAAVADGKSLTKAGEGEGENIDQEDAINSLHVMVFYADGNLQIDNISQCLSVYKWQSFLYVFFLDKFS